MYFQPTINIDKSLKTLNIMIKVRPARKSDNEALLSIHKNSPQGTTIILSTDSSPDYFNRTKAYKNSHVFVAEENGNVIGASSCAIIDTVIDGKTCKARYGFGVMVDPAHRRKGVAFQLGNQAMELLKEKVDLRFAIIIQGNTPSINLITKRGSKLMRDFHNVSLFVYKGPPAEHPEYIRSMREEDTEDVVALLNKHYKEYDLYKPYTKTSFLQEIERKPFYEIGDINLYVDEKGVRACLGLWDYNKILRLSILDIPQEMIDQSIASNAPFIPEKGLTLVNYYGTHLAYDDEGLCSDLVRYSLNELNDRGAHYLNIPLDVESQAYGWVSKLPNITTPFHLFAKPSEGKVFPMMGKNPIYVDSAHL